MPWYVNILIIAVLFYFNGIFAMYEIAMVSAKKTRLQQRKDDGNQGAAAALELLEDPNQRYRSAFQVMITLIDTLAGGIGGCHSFHAVSKCAPHSSMAEWAQLYLLALILVVGYHLFFDSCGELIPKVLRSMSRMIVVCRLSPSIRNLTKVLGPVTKLLSASTIFGIKLLRIDLQGEPPISEDEIRIYLDQGVDVGVIEQAEFGDVFRVISAWETAA
jgi:putative hemolysin